MYRFTGRGIIFLVCILITTANNDIGISLVAGALLFFIAGILIEIADTSERIAITAVDTVIAISAISAYFFTQCGMLIPYIVMPIWKKKYFISRLALALIGCMGFFNYKNERKIYELALILLLVIVAFLISYAADKIELLEEKMHSIRDNSAEHDILMHHVNKQLIETQDAKIYNATLRERNRIAREIHDNVGHMLTRSILQVGAISVVNKDDNVNELLTEVKKTLDAAMDSMRKSVHDLYDESVDFKHSLEQLKNIAVDFEYKLEYDCSNQVPRVIKYAFISIAREAVNNAVKHSNGTQIKVIVDEHPAFYRLQIVDDGDSFNNKPVSDGIGLRNIRERVASLNGTISVEAEKGFSIFVTVMKKYRGKGE